MGYAQLFLQDKTWAFALLVEGWSVIPVVAKLKVTIYKLKTENFHLGAVPARKSGSGAPRKMFLLTSTRGEGRPFDYSHQPERETSQPPAERLDVNYSTPSSEGLKITSTPRCQDTASDGSYKEATSGFLSEIQGVDIGRLAESNVKR
ncbi:hypothetical protein E2C01_083916 [Portunus trituberculatus]|uniref:Uncharacterized protein n=1 Tax=Portunus trituberculatus TaxID=210409 RepID=A0A5B7J7U4_PORTR|nr:hypothetical protein [Portunus trituberculatus]